MSHPIENEDVKKDVSLSERSFTPSARITKASPLRSLKVPTNLGVSHVTSSPPPSTHGGSLNDAPSEASVDKTSLSSIHQNTMTTSDTGNDILSMGNSFTRYVPMPFEMPSNSFTSLPTSQTTPKSTGSSSSVGSTDFWPTVTTVKVSGLTGTGVTEMIHSFHTPAGITQSNVPQAGQLTNQLQMSAVPARIEKMDGKKAQKRERETVQGPSRESGETVLEAMLYDPNYMTTRFCDSKNLVKTKIANKPKKSMSTTPYCAVKWDDVDDDDDDDDDGQSIGIIAEQPAQYMSKSKRKKLKRLERAAAAAGGSSTSMGSNHTDQSNDQGFSMQMEQPAKTGMKVNKRMKKKKRARDAAVATGLTDDLDSLDV